MKRSSHRSDCASMASNDTFFDDNSSIEMDGDNKRKSRNLSEKKRRDQFNVLVNELCSMVRCEGYVDEEHVPPATGSSGQQRHNGGTPDAYSNSRSSSSMSLRKMDKSSVLRSTIDFLKLYYESKKSSQAAVQADAEKEMDEDVESSDSWKPPFLSYEEFGYLMLDALDAFILVIDPDVMGTITYASESILSLLGYNHKRFFSSPAKTSSEGDQEQADDSTSMEEKSTSIYDLVHESDHPSFRSLLHQQQQQHHHHSKSSYLSAAIHMKHNRSYPVSFELIRLLGSFSNSAANHEPANADTKKQTFVSIGRLQTPKILKELRLIPTIDMHHFNKEFSSRHSLEWKFLFLDHRASSLIGYMPFEVLGTSGYDYYHWDDLAIVVSGHEQLMQRGEGTSQQYRFLTKGQQWIWIKTRSYITYHQWNSKPEFIVCTHTITGFDEESEEQQNRRMDTYEQRQQQQQKNMEEEDSCYRNQLIESMEIAIPSSSSSGSSCGESESRSRSRQTTKRRYQQADRNNSMMMDSNQFPNSSSGYASRNGSSSESQSYSCSDNKYERNNLSLPSESLNSLLTDPYSYCDPVLSSQHQAGIIPPHHHNNHHPHHHHHPAAGPIDQSQAQKILKKKHSLLQAHIQQQQEQLRRMEEQLFNAPFHLHHRMQDESSGIDQSSSQSPAGSLQTTSRHSSGIPLSSSPHVGPDFVRSFIELTAAAKATIEMDQHHEVHERQQDGGETMMCESSSEPMFTWHTGSL